MLLQIYETERAQNCKISSLVLMGIGEPLDNFDNVLRFLQLLSDPNGYGMSLRHVTVSTCGVVPKILELAEQRLGLTLSVSLHCPNEQLNYHATFTKGTIEFRLFQFDKPANGRKNGLHAGQLKSYIQLCLALSEMAKGLRTASPKPQQTENPKFAMRTWLIRLGLVGEEFATARTFLTKNLDGDAAFRFGR